MFSPQFVKPVGRQSQFGRVGFARQANSRQHEAAVRFDMATQIGERTAHADKVIDQHVSAAWVNQTIKFRLAGQSPKPISPSMWHDIDLYNTVVQRSVKYLPEPFCKNLGDGIHTFTLKRMCGDQRGFGIRRKTPHLQRTFYIEGTKHQCNGGIIVANLGRAVGRVLLNRRLTSVNQHLWKNSLRCARWLDYVCHVINFLK